jgi:galactose mutarotase-like enzyme
MNLASRLHGPHNRSALMRFSMSGRLTPLLVGLLCVCLVGASLEFGHGHLHLLTAKIDPQVTVPQYPSGPGGQDVLRLSRTPSSIGEDPEFLSVTLLPGRGMNVFQIMALVPGRGDVPLLASPSLANVANLLSGLGADSGGANSTTLGGALLLPWARRLTGVPVSNDASTPLLQTDWQGQMFQVPADAPGSNTSVEGLLLKQGATSVQTEVLPDGQSAVAVFQAGSFSGRWPSSLEITVRVELEAHELDLTMTAKNAGNLPMPLGAGWQPIFSLPSSGRGNTVLMIPSTTVVEVDHGTTLPTGRTISVAHTAQDFSSADGTRLGQGGLDETYTDLQKSPQAPGPVAELRDPESDFLLRLVALSPNITSLHVLAPLNKNWISISPNTNFDDPLGPKWASPHSSGMVTLAPGESFQWMVRLEIARIRTMDSAN